jgi:uncharacterized protein (TIGR03086 family)
MTTTTDARPLLKAAFAQATDLYDAVTPDQLDNPTACREFDVRALLAHLRAVADRIAALPTGADVTAMPTSVDGGDAFAVRADRALTAWSDDDVLSRILTVPWGRLPGSAIVGAYVVEVVTHSWDLADATGRTDRLDDDLSAAALAMAERAVPAERDEFPFDAPVPVADDADPHTRLAAWMGRRSVTTR